MAKKSFFISVSLLSFLALAIRLFLIYYRAPSPDEIWGLFETEASFKTIWLGTAAERVGPFFFSLNHFVFSFLNLPSSVFGLRLISLFWAILAAISTAFIGDYLGGKKIGLIAFILTLFLPASIWPAVFARFYSFLIFLTTAAIYLFLNFLKTKKTKYLICLTVTTIIGVYTHYYFPLLSIAFGAYLLLTKKGFVLIKKWFYSLLVVGVLFLPRIYYLFVFPKGMAVSMVNNLLKVPASFPANLISYETILYFYYHRLSLVPILFLFCLSLFFAFMFWQGLKAWQKDYRLLFSLIVFLPLMIIILVSYFFRPVFGVNSLLIFWPAFILILAKGIDSILKKRPVAILVLAIFIGSSLFFFFQSSAWIKVFSFPYRFINNEWQKNDLILQADLYPFIQTKYYLKEAANWGAVATTYPREIENVFGYQLISQDELTKHQGRIWYFEPTYYNIAEAKSFKEKLDSYFSLTKSQFFPENNLTLYLYQSRKIK